jgi:microsomal dipeptidase-like Zn-dependent dipeptidase
LVVDGHDEARIKKILGGNALRAIHQGWGKLT